MPYDPTQLSTQDPASKPWALAWVRKLTGDKLEPELQNDDEWQAELEADAVKIDAVVYFRPHKTAARVIEADPDWAKSESLLGGSVTNRSPASVAASIRRTGAWIDRLIEDKAGITLSEPPPAVTLRPGF